MPGPNLDALALPEQRQRFSGGVSARISVCAGRLRACIVAPFTLRCLLASRRSAGAVGHHFKLATEPNEIRVHPCTNTKKSPRFESEQLLAQFG